MSSLMDRTRKENKKQKEERTRLDAIMNEKIALEIKDRSTHLGKVEKVDTAPPWTGDIPFNKERKI